MSEPQPVVEEVVEQAVTQVTNTLFNFEVFVEQAVTQVTNTLFNFEVFWESADIESCSEAENFQNTNTAKPDAVTVDEVEAQPVDLKLGDNESKNEEADVLLFADSLLSCLSRKKVKERKILRGLAKYRN